MARHGTRRVSHACVSAANPNAARSDAHQTVCDPPPVGARHAYGWVAETGTLVLASGAGNPASLAFLPEVDIGDVARATIAASFEDAFALHASELGPKRWPRAVSLVSGVSRTGDIGGQSPRK
ncbi:LUD domain-containing protein [uncultured Hyphomicrobium sp.]|uniref:LUD domain-containing protein n=1 Tax=uncultured Hyphomicrobium sp. TaxID=194373 RepID=UPI003453CB9D